MVGNTGAHPLAVQLRRHFEAKSAHFSRRCELIRDFFASQVRACKRIDKALFGTMSIDGNQAFVGYVDRLVEDGSIVADVGGGKTPFFTLEEVAKRHLRVTGIDIDAGELSRAPPGAYERLIVSAIEECAGPEDHDYVIAQSVLEHVKHGREAATGIGSLLRSGGKVVTFCPCRRAWFARLNLLLPESLKRSILFWIFPEKRERQGYPAFYDGCTPTELEHNLRAAGVSKLEVRYYFTSSYFMFFVPFYLVWRFVTFPLMRLWPARYCETFMFIGKKSIG